MKKKLLILTLILIVCFIVIYPLASCGGNNNNNAINDGADKNNAQDSEENGNVYNSGELDCKGETFTFLNMTMVDWGFYTDIVHDTMMDEVLDDAIYERTLAIEERFSVKLNKIEEGQGEATDKFKTAVMAGDAVYDAAFIQADSVGGLIQESLLMNLNDIPQLKLDQEWWNQSVIKDSAIGYSKSLYFAFSDISIAALQCGWCIFMNEDMMINLGLELPYDFVKAGAWTYDKMQEYMKAGAQLNGGANNFKFEKDGTAIYGFTTFGSGVTALLTASGEFGAKLDDECMPYISAGSERFYNVVDKLADMLVAGKTQGHFISANQSPPSVNHFEAIFGNSRAMLMAGEMKAADRFRNMEDTFGILPMPKYDEAQSRYYTPLTYYASPVMMIPTTNGDTERAGIILDAMAQISTRNVRPIFFDTVMAQKRLRNEESIDMLHLIRDSMIYDIGNVYGWTSNIMSEIVTPLDAGRAPKTASVFEKQIPISQGNMDRMMELID